MCECLNEARQTTTSDHNQTKGITLVGCVQVYVDIMWRVLGQVLQWRSSRSVIVLCQGPLSLLDLDVVALSTLLWMILLWVPLVDIE